MMNIINAIPDYMGWMLTGALWAFVVVAAVQVVKEVVNMVKENKEFDIEE